MRNLARARKARVRPWQELASGNTTERMGMFQVPGAGGHALGSCGFVTCLAIDSERFDGEVLPEMWGIAPRRGQCLPTLLVAHHNARERAAFARQTHRLRVSGRGPGRACLRSVLIKDGQGARGSPAFALPPSGGFRIGADAGDRAAVTQRRGWSAAPIGRRPRLCRGPRQPTTRS